MKFEIDLARRFLFSKKRQGFLSLASKVAMGGLAFGVGCLLVALSVLSGFQKEYKKAILGFNSHLVLLSMSGFGDPEVLAASLEKKSEAAGKWTGWSPFLYREGLIVSGGQVKGVVVKGVDFSRYGSLSGMRVDTPPEGGLVLGKTLFEDLQTEATDLRILFPEKKGEGLKNIKKFTRAGVFESGLYEYDSAFALLSLHDAEKIFKTDGMVTGLEIWLSNPDDAERVATALRPELEPSYTLLTWRELNENVFRALEVEKYIFGFLMLLLVAVASLNILGALVLLILSKRGEVALLRAVGLSWSRLRKVFLFDGLLIGSGGIFLGILLGLAGLWILKVWSPIELSPEVYFVRQVPVDLSVDLVLQVVGASMLIVALGCGIAVGKLHKIPVLRALLEK